jgi:hypothetical protein
MSQSGKPVSRNRGLALVLVLALAAIVGVLSTAALQQALFSEALASSRLLHLRAALLSDAGVDQAIAMLAAAPEVGETTREIRPLPGNSDSALIRLRRLGPAQVPAGMSLGPGLFSAQGYAIESQGRGPRGTSAMQTQGITRIELRPAVPAP